MEDKITAIRPAGFAEPIPAIEVAGRLWVNTARNGEPIIPAAFAPCAKVLDCGAYINLSVWRRACVMAALKRHPECCYE